MPLSQELLLAYYAFFAVGAVSVGHLAASAAGLLPKKGLARIAVAFALGVVIFAVALAADYVVFASGELLEGVPESSGYFPLVFVLVALALGLLLKLAAMALGVPQPKPPQPESAGQQGISPVFTEVPLAPVPQPAAAPAPPAPQPAVVVPQSSVASAQPSRPSEVSQPSLSQSSEPLRQIEAEFGGRVGNGAGGGNSAGSGGAASASSVNAVRLEPSFVEPMPLLSTHSEPARRHRLYEQPAGGNELPGGLREAPLEQSFSQIAQRQASEPRLSEREELELLSKDLKSQAKKQPERKPGAPVVQSSKPFVPQADAPASGKPAADVKLAGAAGQAGTNLFDELGLGAKTSSQPSAVQQAAAQSKSLFDELSATTQPAATAAGAKPETPFQKGSCPNCLAKTARVVFCPHCGNGMCASCASSITPRPEGFEYVCPSCGEKVLVKRRPVGVV